MVAIFQSACSLSWPLTKKWYDESLSANTLISFAVKQALDPLAQLRRLWIRIPKEQIWQERANTIQLCKEDLAHIGATHPVLSWVCFGNQQMMSLPKATVDRRLLEELVEAERSGSLDSIDKPFWLNSDEDWGKMWLLFLSVCGSKIDLLYGIL